MFEISEFPVDRGRFHDLRSFVPESLPLFRSQLGEPNLDDIRKHGHVLTPGRYVGSEAAEDNGEPFDEKMKRLTANLREQQAEAAKLDEAITTNLRELGYA